MGPGAKGLGKGGREGGAGEEGSRMKGRGRGIGAQPVGSPQEGRGSGKGSQWQGSPSYRYNGSCLYLSITEKKNKKKTLLV